FVQVAPEWDGGLDQLVAAAGEPDGPTAVFASNDRGAAAVVAAALDRGLRVQEDLSVIGYDNTALAQVLRPALTSVDQPRPQMGRLAMDQLAELMAGGEARHQVVEPELVVRGSAARARSAQLTPVDAHLDCWRDAEAPVPTGPRASG